MPGTSSDAVRACGFHATSPVSSIGFAEQEGRLRSPVSHSAETLLEVARNPQHLGAEIGFFSVLHTWSQKLELHPHVHCVVPAGGLSVDRTRWIKPRYDFFLPVKVLSRVFRGKFHEALKRAFQNGQLNFHGDLKLLAQPKVFAAWLRPLFRKDWVVYAKPPFGGPEYELRYLGRYTHRVAISNHRLVSFPDQKVTFRWRDSAHNNEQRLMTLSRRIPTSLPVAPASGQLRTHPQLWLPGQPAPCHVLASLLFVARLDTANTARHLTHQGLH